MAPGAHGSNRTGRVFTGDGSGEWLYRALHRAGFASQPDATHRDDGLMLRDVFITAAVRCAPPANKPTPDQRARCLPYLREELAALDAARVIVTLGKLADDAVHGLVKELGRYRTPRAPFAHLAETAVELPRSRHDGPRVVPPEPPEHEHRRADRADARRRLHARAKLLDRLGLQP